MFLTSCLATASMFAGCQRADNPKPLVSSRKPASNTRNNNTEKNMSISRAEYVKLLKQIKKTLFAYIPEYFSKIELKSAAYCLFLLYDDGSAYDDYSPVIEIGTSELLDACNRGKIDGIGDASNPGKAWRPHQCISAPFPGFPCPGERLDVVSDAVNACYQFEFENQIEQEKSFRQTMLDTAFELNKLNWTNLNKVTDHFFVLATDYIGYNFFEDLEQCLTKSKLETILATYPNLAAKDCG
jgi:hypothetical protein